MYTVLNLPKFNVTTILFIFITNYFCFISWKSSNQV